MSDMFVTVSRYTRPDGSLLVHAYGPFPDRLTAHRCRRQIQAEARTGGYADALELHTCKVITTDE